MVVCGRECNAISGRGLYGGHGGRTKRSLASALDALPVALAPAADGQRRTRLLPSTRERALRSLHIDGQGTREMLNKLIFIRAGTVIA